MTWWEDFDTRQRLADRDRRRNRQAWYATGVLVALLLVARACS